MYGKPFDQDAGIDIYYYGARYYDPELGRFLAVDPLASRNSALSPYVYVRNNPLMRIDPSGLTDITFTVNRTRETKQSTTATYILSNSRNKATESGATLELPWRSNQVNKSRIVAGTYDAFLRTGKGTFNYPRITLKGVKDRTGIVVHRGNTAKDSKGCILCGTTVGKDRVENLQKTVTSIGEYILNTIAADKKRKDNYHSYS